LREANPKRHAGAQLEEAAVEPKGNSKDERRCREGVTQE